MYRAKEGVPGNTADIAHVPYCVPVDHASLPPLQQHMQDSHTGPNPSQVAPATSLNMCALSLSVVTVAVV